MDECSPGLGGADPARQMVAARITLPHFSVFAAMNFEKTGGRTWKHGAAQFGKAIAPPGARWCLGVQNRIVLTAPLGPS
jgi:hypothetical protein